MTSLLGKTPLQRITLLLTLAEAAIVITVEAILFHYFASASALDDGPSKGVPIYLMIFILAEVMQCILVWDAIRSQNTIQILGVVFFHACCFLYSCLQLSQIHLAYSNLSSSEQDSASYPPYSRLQASLIIVIVVTGLSELAFLWLSWKLFQEFGWRIYKKIGADVRKKRMYRAYHILLMLLKLDVFFFIGFAVQFMMLVLKIEDTELPLTIAALPIIILILLAAVYAVRREQVHMMFAFMVGLLCAIAYFLFKTIRIWTDPERKRKYENVKYYLTVFSVISLLMSLITLLQAIICYRHFGKGLRPYLLREGAGLERPDGREGRIMALETEDEAAQVTRMAQFHPSSASPPFPSQGNKEGHVPSLPPYVTGPTGLTRGGSVYMANPAFLSSPPNPHEPDAHPPSSEASDELPDSERSWSLMDSKMHAHSHPLDPGKSSSSSFSSSSQSSETPSSRPGRFAQHGLSSTGSGTSLSADTDLPSTRYGNPTHLSSSSTHPANGPSIPQHGYTTSQGSIPTSHDYGLVSANQYEYYSTTQDIQDPYSSPNPRSSSTADHPYERAERRYDPPHNPHHHGHAQPHPHASSDSPIPGDHSDPYAPRDSRQ